jgi:hypothetical protein
MTKKGKLRENVAREVLRTLQEQEVLCEVLWSTPFDSHDIRGTDVIVTAVPDTVREEFPLQVTGPLWIEEHYLKHPECPVVSVDLEIGRAVLHKFIIVQIAGAIVLESLRRKGKLLSFRPESHLGRTGMTGVTSSFYIITKKVVMRRVNVGMDLPYLVSAERPRDLMSFDPREGREALNNLLSKIELLQIL